MASSLDETMHAPPAGPWLLGVVTAGESESPGGVANPAAPLETVGERGWSVKGAL